MKALFWPEGTPAAVPMRWHSKYKLEVFYHSFPRKYRKIFDSGLPFQQATVAGRPPLAARKSPIALLRNL